MRTNPYCYVLIACLLLLCSKADAQNLVPNSSFELNSGCPTGLGDFTATSWYSPTSANPDYFNSCAPAYPNSMVSVPQNIKGYQTPHSGNAYAGLRLLHMMNYTAASMYRGYLQARLKSPLIAGKKYNFEMYVNWPDWVGISSYIDICITANPNPPYPPQTSSTSMIIDDSTWTRVTGIYFAQGGEEYITIGNFSNMDPFLYWRDTLSPNNYSPYFYFDDVKLEPCTSTVKVPHLPDTVFLCNAYEGAVISVGILSATKYLWSTGATTPSIKVTQPGTYIVTLEGVPPSYCTIIDTVVVLPTSIYNIGLGPDKMLCPHDQITLGSQATGISYLWSTGSTNASITVTDSGTYWLQATLNNLCKNRDTVTVKKSPLDVLDLGKDRAVCGVPFVILNADVPGALSYAWNTHEITPDIVVRQPGTYRVIVKDSLCTISDSITIISNPYPDIRLGNDTILCKPAVLVLNAHNSGANYLWSTGSTTQSISVNQAGTYTVTVEREGCISRDTINVTFENGPVVNLGNDTTLCQGSLLKLDATTTGAAYKWNTGHITPSIIAGTPGKYTVEVTRGVCKTRDSITIYHQLKPQLDLGPDISICAGQQFVILQAPPADAYLWQNGSKANAFLINSGGLFWLEITKGLCKVRDSINATPKPIPIVKLGKNKTLCKENTLELNAGNPGSTFSWNDQSTSQIKQAKPPGLYSVKVTNPEGCVATDSILLDTFTSPYVWLGKDSFLCEGGTVLLDAGTQYPEYTWQDGTQGNRYEATHDGIYSVIAKDVNHCIALDSILLQSKAKPSINLRHEIKACEPDFEISLPDSFIAYQWQDGSVAPTYRVKGYGQYSVTVTDINYCMNTAAVEVKNNCPGIVHVPNAFTPLNGDGINDSFYPVVKNIKALNFQVYNRWGQLLFETTELNKGWNGIHRDEYSVADMYVYKIVYTGMDDQTKMVSGDFTLLK